MLELFKKQSKSSFIFKLKRLTMKIKFINLLFSVFGVLLLLILRYTSVFDYCDKNTTYLLCAKYLEFIYNVFLFFPFLLFFSIFTYKMPGYVFKTWWVFAKYATPIIFILSILINSGIHHNPNGIWQDMLDIPMLVSLYTIFILGSVAQIIRGYYRKGRD